jgi:ribonuclease R
MVAGYKIPQKPTREELQGLVNATRGTPAARAVHMAVLRTLSKAEYSPALVGHFALASNAYAHFTSPIRRYADLTVHRALAEYLKLTDNGQNPPKGEGEWAKLGNKLGDKQDCLDEKELLEIGHNATMREINASDAEDSLRRFLVLQLLSTRLGEEFPGVITGVNVKGVFVQLDKYVIDGFVKSTDLPGDTTRGNAIPFWKLDPRSGALVDEKSGRSYNMGDSVKVKIVSVDLPRREMELVVSDGTGRAVGKIKLAGPLGGGMGGGKGLGFGSLDSGRGMTGSQRRSAKSKKRDKNKGSHRRDA